MFAHRISPPAGTPPSDNLPNPQALRRYQKTGLVVLLVLLLSLLASASVIRLAGAVVASGEVIVASQVKTLSHPTGGVISALFIKEGDEVSTGDPLIRFDSNVAATGAAMTAMTLDQFLARRARLRAERDGLSAIAFPPEIAPETRAGEQRLFNLRRTALAGEQEQLKERVRQLEQQIASYQAQITAYRQQQDLIEPERQAVRDLWERRLVTINRLNELERTAVSLQGSIAALQADIAQTRSRIAEIRQQSIQLVRQHRSEAATQLAETEQRIGEQRQRSASASETFDRSILRSPASGIVDQLSYTTVGGVIPPAQPILRIVPYGPLEVEARIPPADREQLRLGQSARIAFSGLNRQTTPDLFGSLVFISAERHDDPRTGESFYVARVAIAPDEHDRLEGVRLVPGMPAELYIEAGRRSLLSFLTRPLADQFARAFREN